MFNHESLIIYSTVSYFLARKRLIDKTGAIHKFLLRPKRILLAGTTPGLPDQIGQQVNMESYTVKDTRETCLKS